MKIKLLCITISLICIGILVYDKYYTKQVVYISFKDLPGYSYRFVKDSLGQDESVEIKQEGQFSYISWALDIEKENVLKKEGFFVEQVDIVSQYWIINNFSGLQIAMNPRKPLDYDMRVIKSCENDSLYIYPISQLHYLIE